MWAASQINRFINRLKDGDIFTTRDVVHLANRSMVDQTLKRWVDRGSVRRIARGVFMRTFSHSRDVTPEEIARVKAESFGKSFRADNGEFRVSGRSSSFGLGKSRIQLKESKRQ